MGVAYWRPASAGRGLQPARLQYGSAAVQHLCSRAAANGGPGAPRWGCGCCTVRVGLGGDGGRGRCRGGVQGMGKDSGLECMG